MWIKLRRRRTKISPAKSEYKKFKEPDELSNCSSSSNESDYRCRRSREDSDLRLTYFPFNVSSRMFFVLPWTGTGMKFPKTLSKEFRRKQLLFRALLLRSQIEGQENFHFSRNADEVFLRFHTPTLHVRVQFSKQSLFGVIKRFTRFPITRSCSSWTSTAARRMKVISLVLGFPVT